MDLVLGTFNLNNLFDRFNFEADLASLEKKDRQVTTTLQLSAEDYENTEVSMVRIQRNPDGRLITEKPSEQRMSVAGRIDTMVQNHGLGVLALQEVENIESLRRFNRDFLATPFPYEVLLEGNDPRFIDVALLSHFPVKNLTSHRLEEHPEVQRPAFGRDLLEVDIFRRTGSRRLVKVFVNHLKSKFIPFDVRPEDRGAADEANNRRRRQQAETVVRIVDRQTRSNERFVVVGDMNDNPESAPLASFRAETGWVDALVNVVESQPPPSSRNDEDAPRNARWTSRFSVSGGADTFDLLDQIWVSASLASHVDHAQIERRPKWLRTSAGVGSDHDPAWIRLAGL